MRWSASLRLLIWGLVLCGSFGAILGRAEEWQAKVSETGIPPPCASISAEAAEQARASGRAMMIDYLRNELPWRGAQVNAYI
jgi:hypothetical protein